MGVAEQENPHQYHDGLKSRGGGERRSGTKGKKGEKREGEKEEKEKKKKRRRGGGQEEKKGKKKKRFRVASRKVRRERHTAQRRQVLGRVRDWNF